mgnify:CR=1 FL=1
MKLLAVLVAVLLALGAMASSEAELPYHLTIPMVARDPTLEEELFAGHNEARAAAGLSPLEWDTGLAAIASEDAARNAARGDIEHDGWYRDQVAAIFPYQNWLGENLLVHTAGPNTDNINLAGFMMDRWISSPGHYENIVFPGYDHVGIGSLRDSEGRTWVAVIFVDLS